jgi:hypothetical protein
MLARAQLLSYALVMLAAGTSAAAQKPNASRNDRTEQAHRLEGEAIIAVADRALRGLQVPSDFPIRWQNAFLKAQQGTFVPFVVTIDAPSLSMPSVLLYVRLAARSGAIREPGDEGRALSRFAVEEVYPIEVRAPAKGPVRIARGLSARAGEYDLVVVVRERVDPENPGLARRTGVLTRRLSLPDFEPNDLNASSVILADRLTVLENAPTDEQLDERPYLIGLSDIQPATDNVLRRDEELIVVFLVYNPFVTPERKFDIEVEYHFFTKAGYRREADGSPSPGVGRPQARDGERYFNHTKPQRFTPAIMGPQFDPSAGQPLMAGQGVPLASFPEGEYRLVIKVTDIVTGKAILREVIFTIVS